MSGKHGRRKHHEEHEEHVNHEAWVIPYADMLTLLMGLFLVMWALGNQDIAKMKSLSKGFAAEVGIAQPGVPGSAGGGVGLLDGTPAATPEKPVVAPTLTAERIAAGEAALATQEQQAAVRAEAAKTLDQTERVIREQVDGAGLGGAVSMRREARGLVVSIVSDDVLFSPGSAELQSAGRTVLDGVTGALKAVPNPIAIEGHTDAIPIATARFPSNWELSTARASVVLRYLIDAHGMPPARLQAAGFGDQRPQGDNASPEGRARNRRVDIAVLSTVTESTPEAAAPAAPTSESTPAPAEGGGDPH